MVKYVWGSIKGNKGGFYEDCWKASLLKVAIHPVRTALWARSKMEDSLPPAGLPALCLTLFGVCPRAWPGLLILGVTFDTVPCRCSSLAAHVITKGSAIGPCCQMQMKHAMSTYWVMPQLLSLSIYPLLPEVKLSCLTEADSRRFFLLYLQLSNPCLPRLFPFLSWTCGQRSLRRTEITMSMM